VGGKVQSGVLAHDAACSVAEGVRQAATAGTPTQTTVNNAEIAYARAVIASCVANNAGQGREPFMQLLHLAAYQAAVVSADNAYAVSVNSAATTAGVSSSVVEGNVPQGQIYGNWASILT